MRYRDFGRRDLRGDLRDPHREHHREHHRGRPPFDPHEAFGPEGDIGHHRHGPFPPPPPPFGPGPWPGTPGFPGFPDFPGGRGGRRGRRHGPGGGRSRRGDVRAAILALLAEGPMHGYEMIQEITERSGRFWRPSPGSVYPTLQLLADEGLVTSVEGSGSKRRYELTEEGRAAAEKHTATPPWTQIAQDVDPHDVNLRDAIGQLMGATMQVANAATENQKQRAIEVLNGARREVYAILGEVEPPPAPADADDDTDDDTDDE
jgi:DNA-binding PadR family transcriptional regulator